MRARSAAMYSPQARPETMYPGTDRVMWIFHGVCGIEVIIRLQQESLRSWRSLVFGVEGWNRSVTSMVCEFVPTRREVRAMNRARRHICVLAVLLLHHFIRLLCFHVSVPAVHVLCR